jgi:hypothetical protein
MQIQPRAGPVQADAPRAAGEAPHRQEDPPGPRPGCSRRSASSPWSQSQLDPMNRAIFPAVQEPSKASREACRSTARSRRDLPVLVLSHHTSACRHAILTRHGRWPWRGGGQQRYEPEPCLAHLSETLETRTRGPWLSRPISARTGRKRGRGKESDPLTRSGWRKRCVTRLVKKVVSGCSDHDNSRA